MGYVGKIMYIIFLFANGKDKKDIYYEANKAI